MNGSPPPELASAPPHLALSILLEDAGLTQADLARMTGRLESWVSRWTHGTQPIPGYVWTMLDQAIRLRQVREAAGPAPQAPRRGRRPQVE